MERTGIPVGSAMPRGMGRGQDGPQRMRSRMPFSTKWAQPTDVACGCAPAVLVSPPACVRPAIAASRREVFGQFPRANGGRLDVHQAERGTRRHRPELRRQNHTRRQDFSARVDSPAMATEYPAGARRRSADLGTRRASGGNCRVSRSRPGERRGPATRAGSRTAGAACRAAADRGRSRRSRPFRPTRPRSSPSPRPRCTSPPRGRAR